MKGHYQDHLYILGDHSIGTAPASCLLDLRFASGRQLQVTTKFAPQGDPRKRLQEAEHVCVMPALRLRQEPVRLVHALDGQKHYGQSLPVRNKKTRPANLILQLAACSRQAVSSKEQCGIGH